MSHNEMIAVISAHRDGKELECKGESGIWSEVINVTWNFPKYDYRIKPGPRVIWVNEYEECGLGQFIFTNKESADEQSSKTPHHRIACRKFVEVIE